MQDGEIQRMDYLKRKDDLLAQDEEIAALQSQVERLEQERDALKVISEKRAECIASLANKNDKLEQENTALRERITAMNSNFDAIVKAGTSVRLLLLRCEKLLRANNIDLPKEQDGDCQHCNGKGCEACDARPLPTPPEQEVE